MENIIVYPGSFCPPTYGHLHIVKKAAQIFPRVTIVCSTNPDKNQRWFSEEECLEMWRAYDLPANVNVTTFNNFNGSSPDFSSLVMIRGIRNQTDLEEEKKVVLLNKKLFGIEKYLYIFCDEKFKEVSSTMVRQLIKEKNIGQLIKCVSPNLIHFLLSKAPC